ncbi:MAG TPA: 50S ribosomal protein L3 [Candidatus Cloacimonadota bacterium]|nr:50S ribosomal protein L3 [Candidatus Cloacimonadota bacterium]HPT71660.1 50S ribosomal protein L3 [Candidatus Cloacimonadota bacterium]
MIGLIGKKIGMTQTFDKDGKVIPVTLIKAGPCKVIQIKSIETDGYNAVQLGFEERAEHRVTKPLLGHFKKFQTTPYRYVREFRLEDISDIDTGETVTVNIFTPHEIIDVIGTSKGRGFTGVMKRHHFSGFIQTHGSHESFRGPGSIGMCATPARVLKGMKMAGQHGNSRVTIKNLQIVKVDEENSLIMVRGAVPGHRNALVVLRKEK